MFYDELCMWAAAEIGTLRKELAAKAAEHFAAHQITLETIRHCERQLAVSREAHERTAEKLTNYIGAVSYEMDVTAALRKELAESEKANAANIAYAKNLADELAEAKARLDKLQKAYDDSSNENSDLAKTIERLEQVIDHE